MRPRGSPPLRESPPESGLFQQVTQMRAIERRGPQGTGLGENQHRLAGTHPFQWDRLLKTIVANSIAEDASEYVAVDLHHYRDRARIPECVFGDPDSHAESQARLARYKEFQLGMI